LGEHAGFAVDDGHGVIMPEKSVPCVPGRG
jgi:hypothetical protein